MRTYSHPVGKKATLEPGTKFRVTDGPYWKLETGEVVPMKARGIMTYRCTVTHPNGYTYIEAHSDKDGDVILHVAGDRRQNPDMPQLVTRPYRITGRVGIRRRRGVRG